MDTLIPRRCLRLTLLLFLLLSHSTLMAAFATENDVWLLVDTEAAALVVMKGDEPREVFKNIAIGRNGAGTKQRRGDDKTPLGRYRISWVNNRSRYHRFYGFNYPNAADANRGYKAGSIDYETHKQLVEADQNRHKPSQNTRLGGYLGIHGIGRGSLAVHQQFNWTHGCIALTNQQIDQLGRWIKQGTVVVIR